jgi:hypothetical protein
VTSHMMHHGRHRIMQATLARQCNICRPALSRQHALQRSTLMCKSIARPLRTLAYVAAAVAPPGPGTTAVPPNKPTVIPGLGMHMPAQLAG